MLKKYVLCLMAILCLVLVACAKPRPTDSPAQLIGGRWLLALDETYPLSPTLRELRAGNPERARELEESGAIIFFIDAARQTVIMQEGEKTKGFNYIVRSESIAENMVVISSSDDDQETLSLQVCGNQLRISWKNDAARSENTLILYRQAE